jgi:hypothetical protein
VAELGTSDEKKSSRSDKRKSPRKAEGLYEIALKL